MSPFSVLTSRSLCNCFLNAIPLHNLPQSGSNHQTDGSHSAALTKQMMLLLLPSDRSEGSRVCKRLIAEETTAGDKRTSEHISVPPLWTSRVISTGALTTSSSTSTNLDGRTLLSVQSAHIPLHTSSHPVFFLYILPFSHTLKHPSIDIRPPCSWPPRNLVLIMGATSCRWARTGQHRNTPVKS